MQLEYSYTSPDIQSSAQEVSEPLQPLEEYKVPETDAYPLPSPHSQEEPDGETIAEAQQADSSEIALQPSVQGVLDLYQQGLTVEQIAQKLHVEKGTVTAYLRSASIELDVTRSDMVVPKGPAYIFAFQAPSETSSQEPTPITLFNDNRTVEIGGQRVQLSFKEYALFEHLLQNPHGSSRENLAASLDIYADTINTSIRVLKKRLKDRLRDFPKVADAIQSVGKNNLLSLNANPLSHAIESEDIVNIGYLQVNTKTGKVLHTDIVLSPSELRLFNLINHNRGRLISHVEIATEVGQRNLDITPDSRVHIRKLKQKLAKTGKHSFDVRSIHGQGYIFDILD